MTTQATASQKLVVSPSPHIHCGEKVSHLYYTILIALLPAVISAVYYFGFHAIRVMAVAISSAMASEWIIQKLFKKSATITDGNAILIGLLFALIIPPSVPWWLVIIGCFISILIGKELFGGTGSNPFAPVLIGWAVLRISWADLMNFDLAMINYDLGVSMEYPLSVLKRLGASGVSNIQTSDLLMGKQAGGMGASAILWIIIGGVFLMIRGVIPWRLSLSFLIGVIIFSTLFHLTDSTKYAGPIFHLLTGNVMIGAFFLATDYSSSPANKIAMIVYGISCGFLIVIFRIWSVYPDGVVFAILIMNIFNPLVDKITPKIPGKKE
ncbi:MAG: RnfABCDGE type electron transport complex subunit D [Spirochaetota bacterium]|nr:RnfABCDGE type electron transport complex subunit D [Spirochaetota bacterium]